MSVSNNDVALQLSAICVNVLGMSRNMKVSYDKLKRKFGVNNFFKEKVTLRDYSCSKRHQTQSNVHQTNIGQVSEDPVQGRPAALWKSQIQPNSGVNAKICDKSRRNESTSINADYG